MEVLNGEERTNHNDNLRGPRTTKPAILGTSTRSNWIRDSKNHASDDVEIISAHDFKPSSVPQDINPNIKTEFTSDSPQVTPTVLPSNVINATSLLVSLSNQPDRAPANGG